MPREAIQIEAQRLATWMRDSVHQMVGVLFGPIGDQLLKLRVDGLVIAAIQHYEVHKSAQLPAASLFTPSGSI